MVEPGNDRRSTGAAEEPVTPRTFAPPGPPDHLPPPTLETRLAAAGACVALALFLVIAIGDTRILSLGVPLVPYFAALAVGVWRVRPASGHDASFRLCSFLLLMQVAVYVIYLWPVALATMAGGDPGSGAANRSIATIAVLAFFLGWIPGLVLLNSARRGGWLMIAAGAGPLLTLGYVAVATPWVLR
jgi:hypothetical protein